MPNATQPDVIKDKTARKQVPAVFKLVDRTFGWENGTTNLDIGGGPWDLFSEQLCKRGVENLVYDPFNRSVEHNNIVIARLMTTPCDTATLSNVLCVIPSTDVRRQVLEFAKKHTRRIAYITVYEGDRSGVGRPTRDGYQLNRRLRQYIPEVQAVFQRVKIYRNMILAYPLDNLSSVR